MRQRLHAWWGNRKVLSPWDAAAWVVGLFVLLVAIPTNQTLGDNPFFFVTHSVSPRTFTALWLILILLLFIGLALVGTLLHRRLSASSFDMLTSAFSFLAGMALIGSAFGWLVGVIGGLAFTWLTRKMLLGKALLLISSVVATVPLATVVIDSDQQSVTVRDVGTPGQRPDVLWVIPDSLQYQLIFDVRGRVRPQFPNLRSLQNDSTTYTRAYAPANGTSLAIPAMLNGVAKISEQSDQRERMVGSAGVASWLGATHDVTLVSEVFPDPCISDRCKTSGLTTGSWTGDLRLLALDTVAVAGANLHPSISGRFPTLNGRWRDFWNSGSEAAEVDQQAEELPNGIEPALLSERDRSQFAIWHYAVTHEPFDLDPQGRPIYPWDPDVISATIGGFNGPFPTSEMEFLARKMYAIDASVFDAKLGDLLRQLRASGKYEDLQVVLTSDHGHAFSRIHSARVGDDETMMWNEVAHVPLMVKAPGQAAAEYVTEPRSTSQIAQTILTASGLSLEGDDPIAPGLDTTPSEGPFTMLEVDVAGEPRIESLPQDLQVSNAWPEESLNFAEEDYPMAVVDDDVELGQPLSGDWEPYRPDEVKPGSSSSPWHIMVVRSPADDRCSQPDGRVLVTHRGVVIGQVLWNRGDLAPKEVSRGFVIVPGVAPDELQWWCQPGSAGG